MFRNVARFSSIATLAAVAAAAIFTTVAKVSTFFTVTTKGKTLNNLWKFFSKCIERRNFYIRLQMQEVKVWVDHWRQLLSMSHIKTNMSSTP